MTCVIEGDHMHLLLFAIDFDGKLFNRSSREWKGNNQQIKNEITAKCPNKRRNRWTKSLSMSGTWVSLFILSFFFFYFFLSWGWWREWKRLFACIPYILDSNPKAIFHLSQKHHSTFNVQHIVVSWIPNIKALSVANNTNNSSSFFIFSWK